MRIFKWINIDQEVEIDLSAEDVGAILLENPDDSLPCVLSGVSNVASFMKNIPDEVIAKMKDDHRRCIANFLEEETGRYRVSATRNGEN